MYEYGGDILMALEMRKNNLKFKDIDLVNELVFKQHSLVRLALNRIFNAVQ